MKDYSVWFDNDEFTLTEGLDPMPDDTPGLLCIKVIRAETWDDAVRQYKDYLVLLEPLCSLVSEHSTSNTDLNGQSNPGNDR